MPRRCHLSCIHRSLLRKIVKSREEVFRVPDASVHSSMGLQWDWTLESVKICQVEFLKSRQVNTLANTLANKLAVSGSKLVSF